MTWELVPYSDSVSREENFHIHIYICHRKSAVLYECFLSRGIHEYNTTALGVYLLMPGYNLFWGFLGASEGVGGLFHNKHAPNQRPEQDLLNLRAIHPKTRRKKRWDKPRKWVCNPINTRAHSPKSRGIEKSNVVAVMAISRRQHTKERVFLVQRTTHVSLPYNGHFFYLFSSTTSIFAKN